MAFSLGLTAQVWKFAVFVGWIIISASTMRRMAVDAQAYSILGSVNGTSLYHSSPYEISDSGFVE
jgi:hypothetical protein